MALAVNKRANFDYEILEKYEAGLVLSGQEVKSIRAGNASLKSSYIALRPAKKRGQAEAFLLNANIPRYKHSGGVKDYEPGRERKLLLKKDEMKRLIGKKKEAGLTLVPLKIYTKHKFLKLEFGLCRGKKKYDKRENIKKRELDREKRVLLKGRGRIKF